jgi:NAD(P)-dependent dehydrogenase (short-subunit alcohol dehydrogenase family)
LSHLCVMNLISLCDDSKLYNDNHKERRPRMQIDISNRTILVTGASSGLGAHFARLFASQGARVVVAARRVDRLQSLVEDIASKGGKAFAVEIDVSDATSTRAAFDAAVAHFGEVDSVVANAGMNSEGMAIDLSADEFDAVFAVNVKGVFLTIQEAGRRMKAAGSKEREHGRIVIIASIAANVVTTGIAAYSASKAAVQQLGKCIAREWARDGISVNMVNPGYISTELNGDWFATDGGQKQIAKWPRRRLMEASDLDPVMLHLVSDASRRVTGSVYTVDDGQSV